MPNQRDIARKLALSQGTVSLALRGDLSISANTRKRVRTAAKRLGYKQNILVSALMSKIRAGRLPKEKGTIAIVVDVLSENVWHTIKPYGQFYQGMRHRAAELGFGVECFFLQTSGMNAVKIDRILHARGIRALILAPPYRGNLNLGMHWEHYACLGIGYGWEDQQFDRIANDHHHNALLACRKLAEFGFKRIGMCLPANMSKTKKARYLPGLLTYQHDLPEEQRIPIFDEDPGEAYCAKFRKWLKKWEPGVLLSFYGWDKKHLEEMRLKVPEDIGVACMFCPDGPFFAGVEEGNWQIGATAVEHLAAQMMRNEYGPPCQPKLTLIEGRWMDGPSLPIPRLVR